jgi:histone H3
MDSDSVVIEQEEVVEEQPVVVNKRKSAPPRRSKKAPQVTKTLVKKKHRFRPGTVALREIRHIQQGTELLIPAQTMKRLIRELAGERQSDIRITKDAYLSIRTAAENFLIDLFADGMNMAVFAGRKTLELRDLRFAIERSGITLSKEYLEAVKKRK